MHSALTVILVKYYTIANSIQKGIDKMISIIKDKCNTETNEEFLSLLLVLSMRLISS